MPLTPQEFVARWRAVKLTERSAAQQHFLDLCQLVGHPTPAEDDPRGERFTFEAGADKLSGGQGWADVWKRGYFAWEYKGKHADLDKAYQQLLQYRESLLNPPLLIVSDIDQIKVHTNFTNTVKKVYTITLNDLLSPAGMSNLRAIFYDPTYFRAEQTPEQVTQKAAEEFARLSDHLRKQGESAPRIAHFSIRLLFCLFAEDIDLLPKGLFTQMVEQGRRRPDAFLPLLRQFFGIMTMGGFFGVQEIRQFDGGLFDSDDVLPLGREGLDILHDVAGLDWSNIEPSIFGTLFQRSLDPSRRSQLGAHYTSRADILLIVEPVLMAPLRREWEVVKAQAREIAQRRDEAGTAQHRSRYQNDLQRLILDFAHRLATVRVLDPACGSGNFLYVSLKLLLELWKEVSVFASEIGLSLLSPLPGVAPSPEQLYGIEIDDYAHELAQATVWIGYIQWLHENGFGVPSEPILKPLDNIKHMDAILAYDEQGRPVEPEWPEAEVIVGNPPFLGGSKLRRELSDKYTESLWTLYGDRIPNAADLVAYWFERARSQIEAIRARRVGLLATQAIRAGASRRVLERIKTTGAIFLAWSDRPWILDGADVRVSVIGFDNGSETQRSLDGQLVTTINSNLTHDVDLTQAHGLKENYGIVFKGTSKAGPFELTSATADQMLKAIGNPNGRPNSDVIRPWASGSDMVGRWRAMWLIDFGTGMTEAKASEYEAPFEYVRQHVYPIRKDNRRAAYAMKWWLHAEPRPGMRRALAHLQRFLVTPRVAKHRTFSWLESQFLPDDRLYVFARDDDYFFGILHSRIHEVWSLATSSRHGVGNDPTYNNTTCFETFPFPWPPGHEPTNDPRVQAIAQAAKELVEKRDAWLNPPGAGEAELKKRTLTNLYNQRPTWLDLAHKKLDAAVFAAYGWPATLSDEEILARLLELNLERTGAAGL